MASRSRRATATPVTEFRHSDIENNAIVYRPRNQSHGAKSDNFTYLLRADNAQPATASLSIDISSAQSTTSAVAQLNIASTPAAGQNTDGHDVATPPSISEKESVELGKRKLSNTHLIVIIMVCLVTGLSIFFFVAVKCYKARRKHVNDDGDGYSTSSHGSSKGAVPYGDSDSEVYTSASDHHDLRKQGPPDSHLQSHSQPHSYPQNRSYTYSKSIPTINITSDSPDRTKPRGQGSRASLPDSDCRHRHYGDESSTLGGKLSSSTETSKTVPSCKVTPLGHLSHPPNTVRTPRGQGQETEDKRSRFNWEQVDPELLDHCRRTNPVLHKNKYWV